MTQTSPETVLQFGAGRFLRGFLDLFLQQADDAGQPFGRAVVVQSTSGARAEMLNESTNGYRVLIRGLDQGSAIDSTVQVNSISRALSATADWDQVLALAGSPELRWLISNTTEAGYATDPGDHLDDRPARAFPARLTQVLWQRFQQGAHPLTILPCELIERNAANLRELVVAQAGYWGLPAEFAAWLTQDLLWLNNLVDRMVITPAGHPEARTDPLLIQVEPYALWAIERPRAGWVCPLSHPAIELVDDLEPYYLRKVRILNGIHSALVARWMPHGYVTVQDALQAAEVRDWVHGLVYEEILPAIAYRVPDVARFARQTLERFDNPFLAHRLADISLNHAAKVATRLQPTRDEYQRLFGKPPVRLEEALAYAA